MLRERNRLALAFFVVPLLAMGCSKNGSISGSVIDVISGEPMAGVLLKIKNASITATSEEDGKFFLKNIEPGKHRVEALKDGYFVGSADVIVGEKEDKEADPIFLVEELPEKGIYVAGEQKTFVRLDGLKRSDHANGFLRVSTRRRSR